MLRAFFALFISTFLLITACTHKSTKPMTSAELKGEAVYHQTCIVCHGPDGTGAVIGAPDFTDPKGRLAKPDAVLLNHIENGFHTAGAPIAMPPRGGNPQYTDEDLKNTLAYIRSQFGEYPHEAHKK